MIPRPRRYPTRPIVAAKSPVLTADTAADMHARYAQGHASPAQDAPGSTQTPETPTDSPQHEESHTA